MAIRYYTKNGVMYAETKYGSVPVTRSMLRSRGLWFAGHQLRRGLSGMQEDHLAPKERAAAFEESLTQLAHEDRNYRDKEGIDMGKDSGKSYLERQQSKHSKTSVPPDDHHLSGADKQVVEDEADAQVREGARQARLECDRVYEAAEDARKAASCEATAADATRTFWQRMKDFFAGV